MSTPIKFTLNFIAIMAVQIFVLNDIVIKSSISILGFPAFIPFIYPLFILLLPVSTPNWLGMIIGLLLWICFAIHPECMPQLVCYWLIADHSYFVCFSNRILKNLEIQFHLYSAWVLVLTLFTSVSPF